MPRKVKEVKAGIPRVFQELRINPRFFEKYFFTTKCWQRQIDIWESVIKYPRTSCKAAYGVGKSFVAARIALWFYFVYPSSIVITTAPTFKLVSSILWKEIYSQYKEIEAKKINTGVKVYETLSLKDPSNPSHFLMGFTTQPKASGDESLGGRFQGIHAKNLLLILDEAAGLPDEVFEGALVMATNPNAKILAIGNAIDNTSYFAKTFLSDGPDTPNGWSKMSINVFDTPNLIEGKVVNPNLPTKEWVEFMKKEYGEDSPEYKAKVMAEFPDQDEKALIPLSLIEKAVTRAAGEVKGLENVKALGIDPAGEGADFTTAYLLDGPSAKCVLWKQTGTTDDFVKVLDPIIKKHNVQRIGIEQGGGYHIALRDALRKLKHSVTEVNFESAPNDITKFYNYKMQVAWSLKERFESKNICLDKDDYLQRELSNLRTEVVSHRGFPVSKLEEKNKMKQRLGRSPDKLDSLLVAQAMLNTRRLAIAI